MLPEDTRQRKEAALDSSMQAQQTSISDHFVDKYWGHLAALMDLRTYGPLD